MDLLIVSRHAAQHMQNQMKPLKRDVACGSGFATLQDVDQDEPTLPSDNMFGN